MEYETYGYHSSGSLIKPKRTKANIKGIELEISSHHWDDYELNDRLDLMIEEGILSVPYRTGKNIECTTTVEDDGSVFKELIIKAGINKRVLKSVKKLSSYLYDVCNNDSSTSCHIHLNDEFLKTIGLKSYDIFKTCEYIAPLLFRISERSLGAMEDWAGSQIGDIDNINIKQRGTKVDNLNGEGESSRYRIVNCRVGRPTTEIRIFSNNCSFNYETIKLYIEFCDVIIEIAEFMKDKKYAEEYENIKEIIEKFFNKRNNKKFIEKYGIDDFFLSEKEIEIRMLENEKNKIINAFRSIKQYHNELNKIKSLLRFLRDYDNELPSSIEILFDGNDIERIENLLIENINSKIILKQNE